MVNETLADFESGATDQTSDLKIALSFQTWPMYSDRVDPLWPTGHAPPLCAAFGRLRVTFGGLRVIDCGPLH